jgi:hypothetical protein
MAMPKGKTKDDQRYEPQTEYERRPRMGMGETRFQEWMRQRERDEAAAQQTKEQRERQPYESWRAHFLASGCSSDDAQKEYRRLQSAGAAERAQQEEDMVLKAQRRRIHQVM